MPSRVITRPRVCELALDRGRRAEESGCAIAGLTQQTKRSNAIVATKMRRATISAALKREHILRSSCMVGSGQDAGVG
jgi:hypothetical protein